MSQSKKTNREFVHLATLNAGGDPVYLGLLNFIGAITLLTSSIAQYLYVLILSAKYFFEFTTLILNLFADIEHKHLAYLAFSIFPPPL